MNDQDMISRLSAATFIAEEVLKAIAVLHGDRAREELLALRKSFIDVFRNSEIPARYEMRHAEMVGPTLETIDGIFNSVLRSLNK